MARVLFTDVRIIDGEAPEAYPGEVLVEGERIAAAGWRARAPRSSPAAAPRSCPGSSRRTRI